MALAVRLAKDHLRVTRSLCHAGYRAEQQMLTLRRLRILRFTPQQGHFANCIPLTG